MIGETVDGRNPKQPSGMYKSGAGFPPSSEACESTSTHRFQHLLFILNPQVCLKLHHCELFMEEIGHPF